MCKKDKQIFEAKKEFFSISLKKTDKQKTLSGDYRLIPVNTIKIQTKQPFFVNTLNHNPHIVIIFGKLFNMRQT